MREIQKKSSRIVFSENTQNEVLETFIYIKMDAEKDETAPAIAFLRLHEDYEMFTKKQHQKVSGSTQIVEIEKKQGQIWNQRPFKSWRPLWTLPF